VSQPPKISVLIPTYNYARFLPEAIESVLAQDFADFELLICDDRSTDNTAEVLAKYAGRDPRIRVQLHPANLGMVNNWNYCLAQARGEYIKFLFGDDKLAHPTALGKLVRLLESNPKATLAACGRTVLDERSLVTGLRQTFSEGLHPRRDVIIRCLMEHANLIGEPSAVLFRKSDAENGFDPVYRQIVDLDLWFRLLEKGDLVYTCDLLCGFRQHSLQQSVRNDADGTAWGEHLTFAAKYAEKPWMPKKAMFPIVYEFRRSARKTAGLRANELHAIEQRVAERLGKGWYGIYWLRHRLMRPLQNLIHSVGKHRRQKAFGEMAGSTR
jgi:glycosyltransferase involved in cell wall biosynthesis